MKKFQLNDFEYELIKDSNGSEAVIITDFLGISCKTDVVIPDVVVDDIPVVGIGVNAFQAATITSIVLPNSINKIDAGAFKNCKQLKHAVFKNGPSGEVFLGRNAFNGCEMLEDISTPIVKHIICLGPAVFKDCKNLNTIPILKNPIPDFTFLRCGVSNIYIDGQVVLSENSFCESNVKQIYCSALSGNWGKPEFISNIKIFAHCLTEDLKALAYNGYPVSLIR